MSSSTSDHAPKTIVAVYGMGEGPAPACEISLEVSDAAFRVEPGDVIDVLISVCASQGHYLRKIVRNAGA